MEATFSQEAKLYLTNLSTALDLAVRESVGDSTQEGSRIIKLSDELATQVATKLREIVEKM